MIQPGRLNNVASNMARAAVERLEMEDTDVSDKLSREAMQDLYSEIWDAIHLKLEEQLWNEVAP